MNQDYGIEILAKLL